MTPEQEYEYQERVAIAMAEGVPKERAEQLAREQVQAPQGELFNKEAA